MIQNRRQMTENRRQTTEDRRQTGRQTGHRHQRLAVAAVMLVLLGLIPTSCATRGPLPMTPSHFPTTVFHTVSPGETLWSLSKRYGVHVEEIMGANNISDPRTLEAGDLLRIPGTSPPRPRPKISGTETTKGWTHIVVHHSATPEGNAQIFDRDHRKRGFWNGLGYHFIICNGTSGTRDGEIQVGDRWIKQLVGAHCNVGRMNEVGIGICLVGDFENGQRVTDRQFDSLIRLVTSLQRSHGIPARNVIRHLDVKTTTECPGQNFPWPDFKAAILPTPAPLFVEHKSRSNRSFLDADMSVYT